MESEKLILLRYTTEKFFIAIFIFSFLLLHAVSVFAKTPLRLYFAAEENRVAIGSEFRVRLLVDSPEPVNAFSAIIRYPIDALEFLNIDTRQSVVNVWVINQGQTELGRIVLGGGMTERFSGNGGEIASLLFRVKEEKSAHVGFDDVKFYAADGKGTALAAAAEPFILNAGNGDIAFPPYVPRIAFTVGIAILLAVLVGAILLLKRKIS